MERELASAEPFSCLIHAGTHGTRAGGSVRAAGTEDRAREREGKGESERGRGRGRETTRPGKRRAGGTGPWSVHARKRATLTHIYALQHTRRGGRRTRTDAAVARKKSGRGQGSRLVGVSGTNPEGGRGSRCTNEPGDGRCEREKRRERGGETARERARVERERRGSGGGRGKEGRTERIERTTSVSERGSRERCIRAPRAAAKKEREAARAGARKKQRSTERTRDTAR